MPKSRKINQYTLDGEFVKEWMSVSEIQRVLGFRTGDICTCCSGKQKTAFKHQWRYADECDGINNIASSDEPFNKPKQINQYTLEGEYIKTWESINNITVECGYNSASICVCCQLKQKTAYNYQWRYTCECEGENNIGKVEKTKCIYWTRERCYEKALLCKNRSEFQYKYRGAYAAALKNDWLDDYTWFERQPNIIADKIHCVYGYFFDELHTVYVGRTKDVVLRDWQHRNTDCPVRRFTKKNNIDVPNMVILEDKLTLDESLIYEDLYVEQYKIDGWNLINTAKTGLGSGSIGTINNGKWTRKKCYEAALDCKSRNEFQRKYSGAYKVAKRNGWLDDYYWLKGKYKEDGYWDIKEHCKNAANECHNRSEFSHKYSRAYVISLKSGWLDEFFPQTKKAA